ncbi:potassium channel AKT1-like [Magnolia sinica]|uniref:potassium channel AKT1-like n=1 Tax=Magnolia sinica TaxID=86752 RepID=UPI0026580AB3|nr:potassium channel AKT1-like [Magnolia sinica]
MSMINVAVGGNTHPSIKEGRLGENNVFLPRHFQSSKGKSVSKGVLYTKFRFLASSLQELIQYRNGTEHASSAISVTQNRKTCYSRGKGRRLFRRDRSALLQATAIHSPHQTVVSATAVESYFLLEHRSVQCWRWNYNNEQSPSASERDERPGDGGSFSRDREHARSGRMDLPLSPCFAAIRGDDLLLHQLLRRGLDPNESDNSGRTALHIAASKGSDNCVLLLLDYGAEPNSRDSEGSIPLWEAILQKHESVIKLLVENGANIYSGDVGQFACTAVELNNLELLKHIVRYGGDVTLPKNNGTTALHVAVCEGNYNIVKFLLDQGADIDKPDAQGWSARALADQQGHEEIKALFQAKKECADHSILVSNPPSVKFIGKFKSEPSIRPSSHDSMPLIGEGGSWGTNLRRRKINNFHNSLFGIMSAAHADDRSPLPSAGPSRCIRPCSIHRARITISCPKKGDVAGKLMLLPESFQELLDIGAKKFGLVPTKVLTKDGAEIDDIELIRDGDHLILVGDDGAREADSQKTGERRVVRKVHGNQSFL